MSKAFSKESDEDTDTEIPESTDLLSKNYVTPFGFNALQTEMRQLFTEERPKIVETVRWAASNGDRSENGDYIYGKKRLREIDRRVRYLSKRLAYAIIVDPEKQKNLSKIFFGATVTYTEENGSLRTVKIVGLDEADITQNKISWVSPVAKALLKATVGDSVKLKTPTGSEALKILAIHY
jgi:transcription elongation factor GreB